jgi:ribosome biogenesis GTPase
VGARLLPLPDAGFVVDTPGLREVGIWGLDLRHLDQCFPEFRSLLERCRFKDCSHTAEPECAVLQAVAKGDIATERYESYAKMRKEG